MTLGASFNKIASLSVIKSWTLAEFFWLCQPWKALPSYSTIRRMRRMGCLDQPLGLQQLGHQDGTLGGAHFGVVADQHVLHARTKDGVFAQAADCGDHAKASVAVQADLGAEGIIVHVDH